ncbi:class I SAM-dependent methyltransferase [Streptomyces sp. CB03238]|uniref:class I SAM-dependent methyltransferase n=1 Tax=Streptomyces sp. CB03238 TaxID=1907777 RepID=UPI000A110563|nr:class I SAM-dependent methyltransferase [Streptomyces sp. CB03238]ORT60628.1 hypothetical protein BKD26_05155 [Streptomyces sp. CB03238]
MGIHSELRVVRHMAFPRVTGATQAERMESLYRPTAHVYDAFREHRLLHGRRDLVGMLPTAPGSHLVDMGAGTGNNIEYLGERRRGECRRITLVDVSASMLDVARRRVERSGWDNVETVLASATDYRPHEQADIVMFSYALTMMPDWFAAVDHAHAILRPGGTIAVCDFYVSRKHPADGVRHAAWRRHLWPAWFSHNNVFLSPDHLPYLRARFSTVQVRERLAPVPYLPARVPYYLFIGTKD